MQSPKPASDLAANILMEKIIDDAVGVILETRAFEALFAHLRQSMRPLAAAIIEQAGEQCDDAQIDAICRTMALQSGLDIWSATPVPDKGFRPLPLQRPERNSPCPCGSGVKYKQCCGAVQTPGLILPADEMAALVLKRLSPAQIAELITRGLSPQTLAAVGHHWLEEGKPVEVVMLLEPLFQDLSRLDERADAAADILSNAYLALDDRATRTAFADYLKTAPNKALRSTGWQRSATMCSDLGDFPGAWRAFKEAQRLTPNAASLSHLEVLLLLSEGRQEEARARAQFWAARLARDPHEDHSDLIATLYTLAEQGLPDFDDALPAEIEAILDGLPNYGERRLIVTVAIEGIEPPVWRRLEVENTLSFTEFHHVLQTALGWENTHLFEFGAGDHRIGMEADIGPFGPPVLPADHVELGHVIGRRKSFSYTYDFGDDWRHRITIERRLVSDPKACPVELLDGARACPPEDCGGLPGYAALITALQHPRRAASKELHAVYGRYDPEAFDLDRVRKDVRAMWRPL